MKLEDLQFEKTCLLNRASANVNKARQHISTKEQWEDIEKESIEVNKLLWEVVDKINSITNN